MTNRVGLAALLAGLAAGALLPTQAHAQKRQRDRITREEIMGSPHKDLDLFQVIRTLRPQFLNPPRGPRSMGGGTRAPAAVAVYIDKKRDIGLEALRNLPASQVEEVRYLDPTRSLNEFGPAVDGGAILVTLYKGKPPTVDTPPAAMR